MVILEQQQQPPQQQCINNMSCAAAAAAAAAVVSAAQQEQLAASAADSGSPEPPQSAAGGSRSSGSGCHSDGETAAGNNKDGNTGCTADDMSPQHCANGLAEARPKLPQSPPQQQPLPQSVSDEPAEQKPLDSASLQQRLGYRQGQLSAWTAHLDAEAQLEGLDSLTRTLLTGAGLGFAECATQELASRLVQPDCPSGSFEALLGDPAVNRNLPEASCLPGLSRLLHSCMDSDATDSDSHDDSVADSDDSSAGVSETSSAALKEREAWFRKRAQLVTRWQWVSQQLSDVDCRLRAYSDLCDRLSNKPWRFDPTSSASRCVPAPPQLLAGGRRRVRLQPPRMSAASTAGGLVRCSCAPPLPGCALCGGWRNRVRPANAQAPISERAQQLDPACHPALGPPADRQHIETAVSSIFRKKRSRQRQQQEQQAGQATKQQQQHRRKPLPSSLDAMSQASSSSSSASAARQKQQQQPHRRQRQNPPPLKIPSLTSTALMKKLQPPLQQHQKPADGDAAVGFNGSADLAAADDGELSPESPPWTPHHYEPIEYREISTPSWRPVPALPPASDIRVYAKLAKPAAANGAAPAQAALRLCRLQETPGMSEDLTDAAYYSRHRPCEKAEHLRNWGRKLRPSPGKAGQPHQQLRLPAAAQVAASPEDDGGYNPGYPLRQFPLPQDPI
ncbi:hypothetical protein BOX15_Mlig010510g2 [Macrostomum lignano]|uniref:PEHE domain-containing protein n=1 Tax=Macrostomum lignano TaxID=282301 RepID=A0A267FDM9_9PLAT|nr:hypothetical protein BOX15_Mlig010510g1 [Macrostomum lignano]PAA79103.1 hypothetical protein BOX15_Mlig010510g2 [Macrostomum lignano]